VPELVELPGIGGHFEADPPAGGRLNKFRATTAQVGRTGISAIGEARNAVGVFRRIFDGHRGL
jgi:hypothetical protein